MLEGSINRKILLFAIPIFFGQMLQQLYNVADSVIVGNFATKADLAAINSSGSFIFLLVGFFTGLFMGMGVIIGSKYGAGDYEAVSTAAHTGVTFALLMGLTFAGVGAIITTPILHLMGTPASVMPKSALYLRIYFLGGPGIVMYNVCCGIFQAMGDSRRPLIYLAIASVTNIGLDLLFIAHFGMGVEGAAIATVIAQTLSGSLVLLNLMHVSGPHRISLRRLSIDRETLGNELRMGLPTGVQNSVVAISNVVVQSHINFFGPDAMAGCGSYFKIEGFVFLPIMAFSMALTTFVSQNLGGGKRDRAEKGAHFGVVAGMGLAEVIGIVLFTFAPQMLRIFSSDPDVIAFGVNQAHMETFFYLFLAYTNCMAGVLRGSGRTSVPMGVMLVCWCVVRVTYLTLILPFFPRIYMVYIVYPFTWSLSSLILFIYGKIHDIYSTERLGIPAVAD